MSHASSLMFLYQMSATSLSTCTLIRPAARLPSRSLLTSSSHGDYPCADSSNASFGLMPESTSPTGYEPNCLIEDNSEDLNEMTSMEIKPMFFHKPSLTSAYGSPNSEFCWRHPCTYRREKQVLTDHEFITLSKKTQCPVHLTSVKVQGNLPCCSHTKRKSNQDTFSDREGISSGHQTVQGEGETFVRFSEPEKTLTLVLEDQREDLFAAAKCEILKQEWKVDFLNTSTREFQRQALSSGISRCRINLQWKIIPRSQSTGNYSKSWWDSEPRS